MRLRPSFLLTPRTCPLPRRLPATTTPLLRLRRQPSSWPRYQSTAINLDRNHAARPSPPGWTTGHVLLCSAATALLAYVYGARDTVWWAPQREEADGPRRYGSVADFEKVGCLLPAPDAAQLCAFRLLPTCAAPWETNPSARTRTTCGPTAFPNGRPPTSTKCPWPSPTPSPRQMCPRLPEYVTGTVCR